MEAELESVLAECEPAVRDHVRKAVREMRERRKTAAAAFADFQEAFVLVSLLIGPQAADRLAKPE
jgi:hypothetical protein